MTEGIGRWGWVELPACPVCGGAETETLATMFSPVLDVSIHVVICRGCGFLTQNPRPDMATYAKVNEVWYGGKRGATFNRDDHDSRLERWRPYYSELFPKAFPNGLARVLDVGAGTGWMAEICREVFGEVEVAAIETWAPYQDFLRTHLGADVYDLDLAELWPETMARRYDLVILRQTLEHLEQPELALENMRSTLASGGQIFIESPNAMNKPERFAFKTSYLRPVHLHYFNVSTLERLTRKCGLKPVLQGQDHNVWGFYADKDDAMLEEAPGAPFVSYKDQLDYSRHCIADTRLTDFKVRAKHIIKRYLPRPAVAGTSHVLRLWR